MLCVENGLDQHRSESACSSRNSVASTTIASREDFSREDEGKCIWLQVENGLTKCVEYDNNSAVSGAMKLQEEAASDK